MSVTVTSTPKFKIGDTVKFIEKGHELLDSIGVVKYIRMTEFAVEFTTRHQICHDCEGYTKLHRGYWCYEKQIELAYVLERRKVTIDSVVLPKEKKEEIKAALSQTKNLELIFKEWGFEEIFEKGFGVTILFWGIPGTGKTLMAQAIADELDSELKAIGPAEIETSEPGGAERNIQNVFAEAKGKKTVILFDECDSLLMDRNEVGPILAGQINTLLSQLELYDGVVIFTTNRLGKIDPALERRITAKIEFPFPDQKARKDIWKRMIPKKCPLNEDVSLDKLADYPLAGGNIKNAVLNAARMAVYKEEKKVSAEHFISAIENEAKSIQAFASEYENQVHHSIGHNLVRSSHGVVINKEMVKAKASDLLDQLKKKGGNHGKQS